MCHFKMTTAIKRCSGFILHVLSEATVEPVSFLYMFTNFLYFPILQSLIFDKVCLQDFDTDFCKELKKDNKNTHYHHVNSQTSHWILMTSVAITIPSAIAVLLLYGPLGDKIGRKVPVILPCVGAFAAYISAMLNAHYMSGSVYYILIGPVINGCCGGFIATIMAVYSYVGHISTSSSKMTRLSIVEASIFFAGTFGVFVSGVILENIGYEYTCVVLIGGITIALIYSIVYLENVKVHNQGDGNEDGCVKLISSYFKDSVQCIAKRREARVFSSLLLQMICVDILMLCTSGDMDVTFIYLRERLGFNQVLYGYYKGLDNFLRGVVLITLPRLAKHFLNINDFILVLVGIVSYVANFVTLSLASAKWIPFLAAIVGMCKGLPSAGLRSKMSSLASKSEQGRMFGLIAVSESIITLVASVLFNNAFPATYDIYPGFVYLISVALLVVSFVLVVLIMRLYPNIDVSGQDYDTLDEDVEILSPENGDVNDSRVVTAGEDGGNLQA